MRLPLLLSIILLASCTKNPEQYQNSPPPNPKFKGNTFTRNLTELLSEEFNDLNPAVSEEEKTKANSSKPILYGVGAAGVTFDMSIYEISEIMEKPSMGPDSDGRAIYPSQILIKYKADDPRKPDYMLVLTGYLGALKANAPVGDIQMGQEFASRYKAGTEEGAKALARDLYRSLEKVNQAGFDCIAAKRCTMNWNGQDSKYFFVTIPKALFMISKDRFSIFRVLLSRSQDLGVLNSEFDLLKGEFSFDLQGAKSQIKLGDSFSSVQRKVGFDVDSEVDTNGFMKDFVHVKLMYTRQNYSRLTQNPIVDGPNITRPDVLKTVVLTQEYEHPFKINGQYVTVKTPSSGHVELKLIKDPKTELGEGEVLVGLRMGLAASVADSFVDQFNALIISELKKFAPNAMVNSKVSGRNNLKSEKFFVSSILAWNPETSRGMYWEYSYEKSLGNIPTIVISEMNPTFEPALSKMIPSLISPLSPAESGAYESFAGFKIGEKVTLTDVDLGRAEATVYFEESGFTSRVDFVPDAQVELAFSEEKTSVMKKAMIALGDVEVKLALDLSEFDEKSGKGTVAMISSDYQMGPVEKICGLDGVSLLQSLPSDDFFKQLHKQIQVTTQADANYRCARRYVSDKAGLNMIAGSYFIDQNLFVNFGNQREATTISIYGRSSQQETP